MHELEETMGRQIVWLKARLWRHFDLVRALKAQGDDLIQRDKLCAASVRYRSVLHVFGRNPLYHLDPFSFTGQTAKLSAMIGRRVQ